MKRLAATLRHNALLFEQADSTRIEGGQPRVFVGIDLHKTSSQHCILSEGGALIGRRIKTAKASFDEVFADRPPARLLVEA